MKPISVHQSKANSLTTQLLIATLLVAGITTYVSINNVSTRFEAGSEEKEVTILFVPEAQSAVVGETITLTPFVTAKVNKPGFMSFALAYDNTKLAFAGTDDASLSPSVEIVTPPEVSDTELRVTYAIKDPTIPPEETLQLSGLKFTVMENVPTSVRIDAAGSQIILLNSQDGLLVAKDGLINTPAN